MEIYIGWSLNYFEEYIFDDIRILDLKKANTCRDQYKKGDIARGRTPKVWIYKTTRVMLIRACSTGC